MRFTIINSQKVMNGNRLDAEFFQIEKLLQKLENIGTDNLQSNSTLITQGPNPYFIENGIPCLTGRNIAKGDIVYEGSDHVDQKQFDEFKKFHLKKLDILITLKGAGSTGKVALFRDDKDVMFSRNLGIIRLSKKSSFQPQFLYAFLLNNIGQQIIDRGVTGGTGQLTLPTGYIKNLNIPVFSKSFQETVSAFVDYAYKQKEESNERYTQANYLLLEELNLNVWQPKHNLFYTRQYSEVENAERFDAEYFQPKYDEILDAVKKVDYLPLGEVVRYSKGIEVGSDAYEDEGVPFIRVSDVSIRGIDRFEKHISEKLYNSLDIKFAPRKGDILMTKDGTIGISFVVDENIKAILSGAFLKLKPKIPIENEYLTLVLNSVVCKQQIEKLSGGALIAHLKPSDAMNLLIPILDKGKQKEINSQVTAAKEARYKSKTLLDIAKHSIEIAIEKNEADAENYIQTECKKLNVDIKEASNSKG